MESINRNNYELFFLDYLEGNLEGSEVKNLKVFLTENPDLANELELELADLTLPSEDLVYDAKSALKMNDDHLLISASTVEEIMVMSIENQLSAKQQVQLEEYIQKNGLSKVFAHYQHTLCVPDVSISFTDKTKLKHNDKPVIILFAKIAAVAAVGLLLISIGFNFNSTDRKYTARTAPLMDEIQTPSHENTSIKEPKTLHEGLINQEDKLFAQDGATVQNKITPIAEGAVNTESNGTSKSFIKNNKSQKETKQIEKLRTKPSPIDRDLPHLNDNAPLLIAMAEPHRPKDGENKVGLENENDMAVVIRSEQPFKLLTNVAENAINKPVVFERDKKNNSEEYIAYRIKLGSFEFERKKSN